MDGLKKLLIGNKLNLLMTARILTESNREKVQSKERLLTANVFLGISRRGSVSIAEENSRAMGNQEFINSYRQCAKAPRKRDQLLMKGTDMYSLCRARVKISCSEIWEVTDR